VSDETFLIAFRRVVFNPLETVENISIMTLSLIIYYYVTPTTLTHHLIYCAEFNSRNQDGKTKQAPHCPVILLYLVVKVLQFYASVRTANPFDVFVKMNIKKIIIIITNRWHCRFLACDYGTFFETLLETVKRLPS